MNNTFPPAELFGQTLSLNIYPPTSDNSLRAWDGADEYMLSLAHELMAADKNLKITVVNDSNGALTLPLNSSINNNINDSFTHRQSITKNLEENQLTSDIAFNAILKGVKTETNIILLKIPKSLALFEFQLSKLRESLKGDVPIIAAGMAKIMPPNFYEIFEKNCSSSEYSLIKKRARYYKGTLTPLEKSNAPQKTSFSHEGIKISSLPGIFSYGNLDQGTRFLLEHFPRLDNPEVIVDPGCGCGILGIKAALTWPKAKVTATDDSTLAVESTRLSANLNGVEENMDIRGTHIMEGISDESVDLVICNPPFHQQHHINLESGFAFIKESVRVLKKGGQLFMVANKYLGYEKKLNELFEGSLIIGQNKKYRVYMCRK